MRTREDDAQDNLSYKSSYRDLEDLVKSEKAPWCDRSHKG